MSHKTGFFGLPFSPNEVALSEGGKMKLTFLPELLKYLYVFYFHPIVHICTIKKKKKLQQLQPDSNCQ